MKNYPVCSASRPGLPAQKGSVQGTFRGRSTLPPFFDIPCLYQPQYPRDPRSEAGLSANSFAIYRISGDAADHTSLVLTPDAQRGNSVRLQSETSIQLQPDYLYLVSYHVSARVPSSLAICPLFDAEPDSCYASYSTGPSGDGAMQSVTNTFLLPVVQTQSSIELQLQTCTDTQAEQLCGTVSVLLLARL